MMNSRHLISLLTIVLLLSASACKKHPYHGFKGLDKKGMKRNKLPSQELKENYKKLNKKAERAFKKQRRKAKKELGTRQGKTPQR